MNLIITDHCNRSCPYCFAEGKVSLGNVGERPGAKHITLDAVCRYLDFLDRSNVTLLKLLGGEPTVHPQFAEIVQLGLERGKTVTVFTNGLWSKRVRKFVAEADPERLSFLFNVNEPHLQQEQENASQQESLALAGKRAMLGFNIYRPEFDLTFVVGVIDRYQLKREVRLGLAHPIAGKDNSYPADDELRAMGSRLVRQLRFLEQNNIIGMVDCGFPLCIFDEAELGALQLTTSGFKSLCEPILDVGAELDVWSCFPLSGLWNVRLEDFPNREALEDYFRKKQSAVKRIGSMEACVGCRYLERNQCCGGCIARTLRNLESQGDNRIIEKMVHLG